MRDSYLTHREITLPAGAARAVDVSGEFFVVRDALGTFGVQVDDGERFEAEQGLEFRLKRNEAFKRLTLFNDSSDDQTIKFYAGRGDLVDKTLNSRVDRTSAVVRNAYCGTYYTAVASLPSLTAFLVEGYRVIFAQGITIASPVRRKAVCLTNLHASLDLYLQDSDGNTMATVFPRQPWTQEIMDDFYVYNPNGVTLSIQIGETFYES